LKNEREESSVRLAAYGLKLELAGVLPGIKDGVDVNRFLTVAINEFILAFDQVAVVLTGKRFLLLSGFGEGG
jgi:hypothetical protein